MEDGPQMPPVPAAGQPVDALAVDAAQEACTQRARHYGRSTLEAKHDRGEDVVQMFHIAATAAHQLQQQQILDGIRQQIVDVVQQAVAAHVPQAVQQAVAAHVQQAVAAHVPPAVQQAVAAHVPPAMQQAVVVHVPPAMQQAVVVQLASIDARLENGRRRARNLRATGAPPVPECPLQPLRKEQQAAAGGAVAGSLPPPGLFPASCSAASRLTAAQLDALEAFYDEQFEGATVADRRTAFMDFATM